MSLFPKNYTLVIVESFLQVITIIKNKLVPDVRIYHNAYKNEPWGKEYWKEYCDTSFHYEPFIQWNGNEYHGKWINMDRAGMRKTWTPSGPIPPAPKQIFVMGRQPSEASAPGMITRSPRICQSFSMQRTNNT